MKIENRPLCILILLFLQILNYSCACYNEPQKPKRVKYSTKDNAPPIDLYRLEVAYQVNKHWITPKNSTCPDTKLTSLVFTILPNGVIKYIAFIERSKCRELDGSAYSAIIRAAPFKNFPNNLKEPEVTLGLRFTLDGVR